MDWTLCLERSIVTGRLLNVWILPSKYMVDYRRLGDFGDLVKSVKTLEDLRDLGELQFEEIYWNWNCCRFT